MSERRVNSKPLRKGIDLPLRILRFLDVNGGEMRLSHLKQQMHAERYEAWQSAYDLLIKLGAVVERLDTVNNQTVRMVTLVEIPEQWLDEWLPTRQVENKRRRRRPQTDWFKKNVLRIGVGDESASRPFCEQSYDNVQATHQLSPSVPAPGSKLKKPEQPVGLAEAAEGLESPANAKKEPITPFFESCDRLIFQFPSGRCFEAAELGGAEVEVDTLRNVDSNGRLVRIVTVVRGEVGVSRPGCIRESRWAFQDDRGVWFDLQKRPLDLPEPAEQLGCGRKDRYN